VVIRQTALVRDARTYHGQEGLLKVISDWTEVFDEFVMTAKDFVDAGNDKVIVRVHQKPRGTESGAALEGDFWFVYTVGDGKLVRLDMFNSKSEALEATGLQE
jgi:ketosteroid isomerase-like protein